MATHLQLYIQRNRGFFSIIVITNLLLVIYLSINFRGSQINVPRITTIISTVGSKSLELITKSSSRDVQAISISVLASTKSFDKDDSRSVIENVSFENSNDNIIFRPQLNLSKTDIGFAHEHLTDVKNNEEQIIGGSSVRLNDMNQWRAKLEFKNVTANQFAKSAINANVQQVHVSENVRKILAGFAVVTVIRCNPEYKNHRRFLYLQIQHLLNLTEAILDQAYHHELYNVSTATNNSSKFKLQDHHVNNVISQLRPVYIFSNQCNATLIRELTDFSIRNVKYNAAFRNVPPDAELAHSIWNRAVFKQVPQGKEIQSLWKLKDFTGILYVKPSYRLKPEFRLDSLIDLMLSSPNDTVILQDDVGVINYTLPKHRPRRRLRPVVKYKEWYASYGRQYASLPRYRDMWARGDSQSERYRSFALISFLNLHHDQASTTSGISSHKKMKCFDQFKNTTSGESCTISVSRGYIDPIACPHNYNLIHAHYVDNIHLKFKAIEMADNGKPLFNLSEHPGVEYKLLNNVLTSIEDSEIKACAIEKHVLKYSNLARKLVNLTSKSTAYIPNKSISKNTASTSCSNSRVLFKTHKWNRRINSTVHAWSRDLNAHGGELSVVAVTESKNILNLLAQESVRHNSESFSVLSYSGKSTTQFIPQEAVENFGKAAEYKQLRFRFASYLSDENSTQSHLGQVRAGRLGLDLNSDKLLWLWCQLTWLPTLAHMLTSTPKNVEFFWLIDYDVAFTGNISTLIDVTKDLNEDLLYPGRWKKIGKKIGWYHLGNVWSNGAKVLGGWASIIRVSRRMVYWILEAMLTPTNWALDEQFYRMVCEAKNCTSKEFQHINTRPYGKLTKYKTFNYVPFPRFKDDISNGKPINQLYHPIKETDIYPGEIWLK